MDQTIRRALDRPRPAILMLNQMAGPMTWELAIDLGNALGQVALLTGHPDTLPKGSTETVRLDPSVPYRRGNGFLRAWCWLRYSVHAFFWAWRFPAQTPIVAFSNPPLIIWICWLLRIMRGTPYAIMVHDIYPDTAICLGAISERNLVVKLWRRLNRLAYEKSSLVMTLGHHMANRLNSQFNVTKTPLGTIVVVAPWADGIAIQRMPKSDNWFAKQYGQTNCLTVMYSGNMGRGHDIETILAAAKRLTHDPRIHFMLIGAGPKWEMAKSRLSESPCANVTLLPWQEETVIPFSLATADVGIVSLEPEMTGLAVPSKAYYFLAAGAPLLGICFAESELADVIEQFECGARLKPGDVDQLVATIQTLATDPVQLARWRGGAARASEFHSRTTNTNRFLTALSDARLISWQAQGTPREQIPI